MRKTKFLIFITCALLFCTTLFGQITFQKTYSAPGYAAGYSVLQTTDGGYIITGSYEILGVGFKTYLIKTNAYGDTLWTKIGGGGGSIQQTTDGGYIMGGSALFKTDVNGNMLWTKSYSITAYAYVAGYSLQQTTDGGFIIAGYAQSSFTSNTSDVYLIKTDTIGNLLWSKTYGGTDRDAGYFVQQTTDGGYIIAGNTASFGLGVDHIYLIKTDTIGNPIWTKTYEGFNGYSVQQTSDGGYIIAGSISGLVYLIKTDANGDTLWTKSIGNPTSYEANCVRETTDGGYIITGAGYVGIGPTSSEKVILIKTDSNGDLLWSTAYGGFNNESGSSVEQTSDGGYIITGYTYSFAPVGIQSAYLIKTDSMGNSGCNQSSNFVMVNTLTTQVTSPATIVSSPATIVTILFPAIIGSGGVVNTLCLSVGINEIPADNSFLISPNPSAGNFTISFERAIAKGNVEILNMLGEIIFIGNVSNESKKEITLKNVSPGIYFVKVLDGEKQFTKKIIIE